MTRLRCLTPTICDFTLALVKKAGSKNRPFAPGALARSMITLAFDGSCIALNQDGLVTSAENNRRAVIQIPLTADEDDIDRAKTRAGVLTAITEGAVTPVVTTSRPDPARSSQAEAAGVTAFVISYP